MLQKNYGFCCTKVQKCHFHYLFKFFPVTSNWVTHKMTILQARMTISTTTFNKQIFFLIFRLKTDIHSNLYKYVYLILVVQFKKMCPKIVYGYSILTVMFDTDVLMRNTRAFVIWSPEWLKECWIFNNQTSHYIFLILCGDSDSFVIYTRTVQKPAAPLFETCSQLH